MCANDKSGSQAETRYDIWYSTATRVEVEGSSKYGSGAGRPVYKSGRKIVRIPSNLKTDELRQRIMVELRQLLREDGVSEEDLSGSGYGAFRK